VELLCGLAHIPCQSCLVGVRANTDERLFCGLYGAGASRVSAQVKTGFQVPSLVLVLHGVETTVVKFGHIRSHGLLQVFTLPFPWPDIKGTILHIS